MSLVLLNGLAMQNFTFSFQPHVRNRPDDIPSHAPAHGRQRTELVVAKRLWWRAYAAVSGKLHLAKMVTGCGAAGKASYEYRFTCNGVND